MANMIKAPMARTAIGIPDKESSIFSKTFPYLFISGYIITNSSL